MYSGSTQRPTSILKSSPPSWIILLRLTILQLRLKLTKSLIYLSSKLHLVSPVGVVYGLLFRCLWRKSYRPILPVSPIVVLILSVSPAGEVSITLIKLKANVYLFESWCCLVLKLGLLLFKQDVTIVPQCFFMALQTSGANSSGLLLLEQGVTHNPTLSLLGFPFWTTLVTYL